MICKLKKKKQLHKSTRQSRISDTSHPKRRFRYLGWNSKWGRALPVCWFDGTKPVGLHVDRSGRDSRLSVGFVSGSVWDNRPNAQKWGKSYQACDYTSDHRGVPSETPESPRLRCKESTFRTFSPAFNSATLNIERGGRGSDCADHRLVTAAQAWTVSLWYRTWLIMNLADHDDDDAHFVLRLMPFSYLFMQPLYYFTAGSKLNSNDLLSGPD